MKKTLLILLCLITVLLLSACRQYAPVTTPTIDAEDIARWNQFQWDCKAGVASSVILNRTTEAGETEQITIAYDGDRYTFTDASGSRNYNYLFSHTNSQQTDEGYVYGDYFFLSDDPNMTYEQYQKAVQSTLKDYMNLMLPTELIFGQVYDTEPIPAFGTTPDAMKNILNTLTKESWAYFGESTFFTTVVYGQNLFISDTSVSKDHFLLNRYDYNGQLQCAVEIPSGRICAMTELSDGSFCVAVETANSEVEFMLFSSTGKLRWFYYLPDSQNISIRYLFHMGDALYGFGTANVGKPNYEDLYMVKFSTDGSLLKSLTAGGSGTERLYHVSIFSNGFTITGDTTSGNGDFPLSADKEETPFRVQVSSDLVLSGLKEDPEAQLISQHHGFHMGIGVYNDATIVIHKESDQLPEEAYAVGIFSWQTGYVIIRAVELEEHPFRNPKYDGQTYFHQLIITYYNADGQPVWQTSSAPYLQ